MARRTIKTIDGQTFSDSLSSFEDRKGYILYRKGAFTSVRVNKRGIVSDDIKGLPASVLMALMVFILMALAIGFLLLNRGISSEIQTNTNVIDRSLNILGHVSYLLFWVAVIGMTLVLIGFLIWGSMKMYYFVDDRKPQDNERKFSKAYGAYRKIVTKLLSWVTNVDMQAEQIPTEQTKKAEAK